MTNETADGPKCLTLRQFYGYAATLFIVVCMMTACIMVAATKLSELSLELLPREQSKLSWEAFPNSDQQQGGISTITSRDKASSFHFDYVVRPAVKFPYFSYTVVFGEFTQPNSVIDLSNYRTLSLNISCTPANTLNFTLYTFDDEVTNNSDFDSYRKSETFFSCAPSARRVDIDLTRLSTPEWWLLKYNVDFAKRNYDRTKILSFALHNSPHSPVNVRSGVKIDSASFTGRNWSTIYTGILLSAVTWGIFIWWFLNGKTSILVTRLSEKAIQERPLLAYQKLPSQPEPENIDRKIMQFIATEYANPNLNLDLIAARLETTRAKINAALKSEVGQTFVAYLNRIRLTEASRLILEEDEGNIAEIAYSVGYNSASYFNTLFKKEYGFSPKVFQKRMRDDKMKAH
ncbi:MAG TPA: AraC family transcriptional regulator [Marinagarivorans sp.]